MENNKKYFFIGLLLVVIVVVITVGSLFMNKGPVVDPINAVPNNAAMIFEINNPCSLSKTVLEESEMYSNFKNLPVFSSFGKQLAYMDSLCRGEKSCRKLLENNKMILSYHFTGLDKFNFLLLAALPSSSHTEYIEGLLEELSGNSSLLKNTFEKVEIKSVVLGEEKKELHYAITNGIFIGSYYPMLIEDAIRQVNRKKSLMQQDCFRKIAGTSGRNTDVNIYLNYKNFSRLASMMFSDEYKSASRFIGDLAEWGELDVIVKKDLLLLNGFSAIDSLGCFLNLFDGNAPQQMDVASMAPYNTSVMVFFGFDDFSSFYKGYKTIINKDKVSAKTIGSIKQVEKRLGIAIEKPIIQTVDKQLAYVIASGERDSHADNSFLLYKTADVEQTKKALRKLSEKTLEKNKATVTNFRGYEIRKVHITLLFSKLLGPLFSSLQSSYYTIINDFVVWGNSPQSIETLIRNHIYGKTLIKNQNYVKFSENISDKANLHVYLNIRKSSSIYNSYLKHDIADLFEENSTIINNLEGLSVQFSAADEMFYTNMCLKYNPQYIEETKTILKSVLDDDIVGHPHLIWDHRERNRKIIVFDKSNQMYMIDGNSKVLWKKKIVGDVISDVFAIDYYKNRKYQYVFNTEDYIYIVDRNGNNVEDYPIKLKNKASNGIVVCDYDRNKKYRMIVASANKIYNFTKDGKRVKGWNVAETKNKVIEPVEHIRIEGIDYVVVTDEKGEVMVLNRRGETKFSIKSMSPGFCALNSSFYADNSRLVCSNENGKICKIKHNGEIETELVRGFSEKHYFLMGDLDGDDSQEYVFIDKKKLYVYENNLEPRFEYEFTASINTAPVLVKTKNKPMILAVSSSAGEVFLFNSDGTLKINPPLEGATKVCAGSLYNNGQVNIIVGKNKNLYNYSVD